MAADPDDEALAWAGDETPEVKRVEPGPTPAGSDASRSDVAAVRVGSETLPAEPRKPAIPAPLLITYGVLGGLYLIYTIGWVLTVAQGAPPRATVFDDIMFRVQQGLAVASPAIWFGAVFLLTRGRKPLVRLLWLLVGLAIVIPWPTVLGV
ncbi:hypothetical protein BH10ACT7_BH10ACT7_10830 [soil metagenome]